MRILMIGGTRFVGRHIVEAALDAGHDVTIFHRGQTGPALFPGVEHRLGDRNGELAALAAGTWDATIDVCAYVPRHVTSLAAALGDRSGSYTFISSVSVYDAPASASYGEDSALCETDDPTNEIVNNDSYGPLKVLCERAARHTFGDSSLVVRPTYVVGPDDYTWRFPWWVGRLASGGEVLAPGPRSDHAQVIDGRDMAEWIVQMVARGSGGTFHTVAPSSSWTWGEQLEQIAATVGPADTTLTWVEEDWLLERGIDGGQLPLWTGGDASRLIMAADPSAAFAAGLTPRPFAETVVDTLAWSRTQEQPPRPGLGRDVEAELLAGWHQRT